MSEWKESYDTPPDGVLLEMICADFNPNHGYTLGYVKDGTLKGGDGEVRWYTLREYLGRECDNSGPRWWRVCPNPSERATQEVDAFSRSVWHLVVISKVDDAKLDQ